MKLVFIIFFFQFSFVLFSQKVIHYTYIKEYEANCQEMKNKSDSAICMWKRSEEYLKDLKKVYSYCPDSLKNISHNNCPYNNFDTLLVCIQNEVKDLLKAKLVTQKTADDRAIIYYEMLSIYYFMRRKELDGFLDIKGVYKK